MSGPHRSTLRASVLRQIGLGPIWRLRSRLAEEEQAQPAATDEPVAAAQPVEPGPTAHTAEVRQFPKIGPASPSAGHPPAQRPQRAPRAPLGGRNLRAVPSPVDGKPDTSPVPNRAETLQIEPDPAFAAHVASLDWEALEAEMRACTRCTLCRQRKQAVPGVGDRRAQWMLVGEAPGAEEDQHGEPFVGQAGQLLDAMIAAIGLRRGEGVYIANAVKCRPPFNRTPEAGELAACQPFLQRQIELVQPRILLALGRPAAQTLLGQEVRIADVRGKVFDYAGIALVVTYHPAYLLRNPLDKARVWEDLLHARSVCVAASSSAD